MRSRATSPISLASLKPGSMQPHATMALARPGGQVSGTLLADMAVGADSRQLQDIKAVTGLPSRNPPEPLLGLGVRTRIRLAAWNSRSEL